MYVQSSCRAASSADSRVPASTMSSTASTSSTSATTLPPTQSSINHPTQIDNSNGDRGVIKYVGPLQNTTTPIYAGIEWYNPTRGKHNGTHSGHAYFTTAYPTSGSFVRTERLLPTMTISHALQEKYLHSMQSSASINDNKYEFVGVSQASQKFGNIQRLQTIVLTHNQIAVVEPATVLHDVIPNVTELDLTGNLLTKWSSVLPAVCSEQLPKLAVLNLSDNYIQPLLTTDGSSVQCKQLHTLILNYMHRDELQCTQSAAKLPLPACNGNSIVDDVVQLVTANVLPALQNLYLSNNHLTSLQPLAASPTALPILRTIDLSYNNLQWPTVYSALSQLPTLGKLVLNNNSISTIDIPDSNAFPALQSLSLDYNIIQSYCCVEQLQKLPQLKVVRLQANPLHLSIDDMLQHPKHDNADQEYKSDDVRPSSSAASTVLHASQTQNDIRYHLVARLPRITTLNGSEVSNRSRGDAERFYVTSAIAEYKRHKQSRGGDAAHMAPIEQLFNRYKELCDGDVNLSAATEPTPAANTSAQPQTTLSKSLLEAQLVHVTQCACTAANSTFAVIANYKQQSKKLPQTLTIGKLQLLLTKLFNLSPAEPPALTYKDKLTEAYELQLTDRMKQLQSYNMESQGYVVVRQNDRCKCKFAAVADSATSKQEEQKSREESKTATANTELYG